MLKTGQFIKKKKDRNRFIENETLTDAFWKEIASKTPDSLLNLGDLSFKWNLRLLQNSGGDFHGLPVSVDELSQFRFKEPVHFTHFLNRYSMGVEKNLVPRSLADVQQIHFSQTPVTQISPFPSLPSPNIPDSVQFENDQPEEMTPKKKIRKRTRYPLCESIQHEPNTSCAFATFEKNPKNYKKRKGESPRDAAIRACSEQQHHQELI